MSAVTDDLPVQVRLNLVTGGPAVQVCDAVTDDLPVQVRLNLISLQSDEKLKTLMMNLHQSLAAKVCYLAFY